MGILGMGESDTATTEKERRSALEQASAGPEDHGAFGNSAVRLIESILDTGIDGRGPFHSAQQVADIALSDNPDVEKAVDSIVSQHLKLAAAGGFLTGLGGFVTLPVALPANVVEFYLVATRMVAAVASARGYDTRQPEIRAAVLLTLVGADSDDLLKKAGVAATGRLSNLAAQRLPGARPHGGQQGRRVPPAQPGGQEDARPAGQGPPRGGWRGRRRPRHLPAQAHLGPGAPRVPAQGPPALTSRGRRCRPRSGMPAARPGHAAYRWGAAGNGQRVPDVGTMFGRMRRT